MKLSKRFPTTNSIMMILFLLFFSLVLSAQPAEYGCHLMHYAQQKRVLTEVEKAELRASMERSDTFDILNYEITVDLTKFSSRLLIAHTIVSFKPMMDDQDEIRFDLEGLVVDSVFFDDFAMTWDYDGRYIKIKFAEALSKGEVYNIHVYYHGNPITCGAFGGFYFENDVAYNLGIGIDCIPHNYGRAWFPCFDNFVERSTYKYNIITNKGRIGYGLGDLVNEEHIGVDTIIRSYVMAQPIPTYLSHIAAGPYTEVNYMADSEFNPVPIQLVVKPKDSTNAKKHFANLNDALNVLESWYGPYMWDYIGYHMTGRGAMEHPTGVAYPEGILSGSNVGLYSHELAHHWWGNVVTLETDADMWIKEGPSAYAEYQVIEYLEGKTASRNALRSNNVNMIRTAHIADDGYLPLSPMPQRITYGVHTYNKGAAMLHNMRGYLGDENFKAGMQYILEERTYGNINAYSFRDLLYEGTGVDMTDFFDDWILSPGWSDFTVESYEYSELGNEVNGTIRQSQYHSGHFHNNVPLPISIYFKDLSVIDTVIMVSDEQTAFNVQVNKKPTAIVVNRNYDLCLASVTSSAEVNKAESLRHSSIPVTIFCSDYTEADIVTIEHHYTSPPPLLDESKSLTLTENHYWKIAMANPGVNEYGLNYRFSAADSNSLDFDVFDGDLDSLLLLYRENEDSDWYEVKEYELMKTGANSGVVIDRNVRPGLYCLARGEKGVYTSVKKSIASDINIYPTIVDDVFTIDGIESRGKILVYSLHGNLVQEYPANNFSEKIELPLVLPGMYIVNILDERGAPVHSQKIIKK